MATAREGPSTGTILRVVFTAYFALAVASVLVIALYSVRNLLVLILVAVFLAVGLDPAVRRLQSWGLRRGLAIGVILLAAVVVLVGFLAAITPPLAEQVAGFAANVPDYIDRLSERFPQLEGYIT